MFQQPTYQAPVPTSWDLERVLRLARRPSVDLESARAQALVELMTGRLRRKDRRHDGTDCGCRALGRPCVDTLLPAQAWGLWEAPLAGGLFGAVRAGAGKTLMDVLVATVMPGRVVVLLVPPKLVEQLVGDYLAAREHFVVPSFVVGGTTISGPSPQTVHVVPYSILSRPEATVLLIELNPDGVVADEMHRLRYPEAVGTGRFIDLFLRRQDAWFCGWSGTPTAKGLADFHHLLALALGEGSPLPIDPREAVKWGAAVDPAEWQAPAGALRHLMEATGTADARSAVRVRLAETRGVVMALNARTCAASVVLRERRPPPVPAGLAATIREVRRTWTRPDGEELVDALQVSRCLRELSCGFYYRWRFIGDPLLELVEEWFAARRAWGAELRAKLSRRIPHLDSPHLCAVAAERARRGEPSTEKAPAWRSATWARWAAVKDLVPHEKEAVWVDDWLARDAADWAAEEPGVVWFTHDAFGTRLGELTGLKVYQGNAGDEAALRAEDGRRSVVLSLRAYGTGFDGLQWAFSRALMSCPVASGDAWEQGICRLFRIGQEADEVIYEVPRHTPEAAQAVDRATARAKYVEGVTSGHQALLAAGVEWRLDPAAARAGEDDPEELAA